MEFQNSKKIFKGHFPFVCNNLLFFGFLVVILYQNMKKNYYFFHIFVVFPSIVELNYSNWNLFLLSTKKEDL